MTNLNLFITLSIIAIVAVVSGFFTLPALLPQIPQQVGCTMEAKICPDGSSVGRTGPACQFAKCPEVLGFATTLRFELNQKITLTDGLNITLTKINDSRCQEGAVCVWAGELSPVFSIDAGTVGEAPQEIILGSTANPKVTKSGYIFELKDTAETAASIIVTQESNVAVGCYVGGCSSQICSDKPDVVSTCEYKEEYACYKTAKCEKQTNGQCGWKQTSELTACLNK